MSNDNCAYTVMTEPRESEGLLGSGLLGRKRESALLAWISAFAGMMHRLLRTLVGLAVLSTSVAFAHHSPATYDLTVTDFAVTGKIKAVEFRNPHSHMVLQAPDKNGKVAEWEVEFSSVNLLVRRGWKFDRIKFGDTVTCIGNPAKTGEPKMYMWSIKLSDGTVFAK